MYTLSLDEVQALAQQSAQPSISIFLPTHRTSPDNQQDPIRFKNLLRQAEDTLAARGLKPREIEAITGPANALLEESLFWRYVYDGLAVYIAPGDFHAYRLPFPVEAQVIVAQSYYVKPVLPQFTNNGHYFILAFSQNEVRLLEGTRHSVAEVEMPENVPGSRADTSDGLNRENREIQVRPVGGGASAFFSSGGDEVSNKVRIEQFLNALDMSLRPLFNAYQSPVVLAGVDYLLPIYRGASEYPHVLAEGRQRLAEAGRPILGIGQPAHGQQGRSRVNAATHGVRGRISHGPQPGKSRGENRSSRRRSGPAVHAVGTPLRKTAQNRLARSLKEGAASREHEHHEQVDFDSRGFGCGGGVFAGLCAQTRRRCLAVPRGDSAG